MNSQERDMSYQDELQHALKMRKTDILRYGGYSASGLSSADVEALKILVEE